MTMTDHEVREQIARAVSLLASAEYSGQLVNVQLPITYPSGKGVAVQVHTHDGRCMVTDAGLGLLEADLEGGSDLFTRWARMVAADFEASFDGQAIFLLDIPFDRLDGAITNVGNASSRAVTLTLLKSAERRERHRNEAVFGRVTELFGESSVSAKEAFRGEFHEWEVHNVLRLASRPPVIFEAVWPHPNSVSNKFMMFSDIKNSSLRNGRISVVTSVQKMGDFAGLLQGVSTVLELDAPRQSYEDYALAA